MLLLITYDSSSPDTAQKLTTIDDAIKAAVTDVPLKPLSSFWLVKSDEDVEVWGSRLGALLAPEDRMAIVRVPNAASINGWLTAAQWEWIRERAV